MVKKKSDDDSSVAGVIDAVNSKFGEKTMTFGASHKPDPYRIPSGIFALDLCTSGGLPVWHSTCFGGPESSGKTSAAGDVIAMAQKLCWRCFKLSCQCSQPSIRQKVVLENIEGTYDPLWFSNIGVDTESLVVVEADYGEQYSDIGESVLSADDCGLLVVDSLATLVPEAEFDASASDDFYAIQAKLIGRMVRRLKQRLIREKKRGHPCAVLFINQARTKIGAMKWENAEIMPGGHQMKHEFSLLVRFGKRALEASDKTKFIDETRGKLQTVTRHSMEITKNKVAIISRTGEFLRSTEFIEKYGLRPGQVDDTSVIINYAKAYDVLVKGASKWEMFDAKYTNLKEVIDFLKDPVNRASVCGEIIDRAKHRIQYGDGDAPHSMLQMQETDDDTEEQEQTS